MIVVRMHREEVHVEADTWTRNDRDLDCLKGDEVVATFKSGYWHAVYESGAVTRPSPERKPFSFHDHPGQ